VTELTHHDADDGFHEIQLSGKQLVFAFMLTATVAVFIFLLGVQVGRNAKTTARVDDVAEPTAAVSGTVPPPSPVTGTGPVGDTAAPAPVGEKLSYATRLESAQPVAEKLKPRSDAAAAEEPLAAAPVETPAPAPAPAEKTVAKEEPKTPRVTEHQAPAKAAAPSGARPGVWVVQLVALKDRGAAAAVVQRLAAKGYPAFVVSPAPGKPSIYRVQVGRYNDRREAEQIAKRLEKEEQFKPWISH
jgi:cell division septation protein DedD